MMRLIQPIVATAWTLGASALGVTVIEETTHDVGRVTENTAISIGVVLSLLAATWWVSRKFAGYDMRLRDGQAMFKEIREILKKLNCQRPGGACPEDDSSRTVDLDPPSDKD